MQFEYVELGYENSEDISLVSEQTMVPRVVRQITSQTLREPSIRLRAPLSKLSSEYFTALADVMPINNSKYVEGGDEPQFIFPDIRLPLVSIRLAIHSLMEDAEHLGDALYGKRIPIDSVNPSRPHNSAFDVETGLKWIIESEVFVLRPDTNDGPELLGNPDRMHQMLVTILCHNINQRLRDLAEQQ